MRPALKTALGGISAALSLVMFVISGAAGTGQYAAAFLSGLLLLVISYKTGRAAAVCSYIVISGAGFFLSAEKSGILLFILLAGYYPLLRSFLEARLKKPGGLIVKAILSVVTGFAYLYTVFYIFGISFVIESISENVLFVIAIAGYVLLFFVYDTALGFFETRYKKAVISLMDRIIR